jgi:hypothetical protein
MAKIKESTLERLKINKKEPFVVIPLKEWLKIEPILEDYLMTKSKKYLQSIKQAREDIKKKRLYIFNLKTGKLTKVKD